jgi:hypothetical protein
LPPRPFVSRCTRTKPSADALPEASIAFLFAAH